MQNPSANIAIFMTKLSVNVNKIAVIRNSRGGNTPDVVILDPPRKGSDEKTLSAIVSAQPKRIVYVSCNPATLARDLKFLKENGYETKKVTAVDMFPHTAHVESVVLMSKIEP